MPRKAKRSRRKSKSGRKDPVARERAIEVLNLMRSKGLSLAPAARRAHTTPRTVLRYAPRALKKLPNGRYAAKPSDDLTRHVFFLTAGGNIEVAVRGPRQAVRVAQYVRAVDRYAKTGDTSALAEFAGRGVRSRGQFHPFITDTEVLDRLANAGELAFEDLYSRRV